MWCNYERSLFWLEETVSRMSSPTVGTTLTVTLLSKIQLRSRLELYVPNFEGGVEQLHQILSLQNPWYNVSLWALFRYEKLTGNQPGVFLILGVPSEELPNILARNLKVAYLTGTINIRLFQDTDIPQNSELGLLPYRKWRKEIQISYPS
ncbi:jg21936 [Pararge aegeria aegeria]|uniref:Jg21936 protein n=1 Tax=Pararge aegeria aegeria TaxID=348720 RepID=A0A8S4QUL4_9NEOP|nr:jg21936 [Pararge aegeria aegeria]